MRTLKLFFDTNLPSKLNGLYRDDVDRIMSIIAERFKLVASPTTFCELLDRLQGGDGSQFASDKEAFKVMFGGEVGEFLPMPCAFALGLLLGDFPVTKLAPVHFENALSCIFHANSREDLFGMRVQIPDVGRCGFNPQVIRQQHEEGKAQHREWLENIRDGKVTLLPPVPWARAYARILGQSLNDEQAGRFANGLDAMYQYYKELYRIVPGNHSYNFVKGSGDWIDLQQLHYLYDPSIHLLTDDRRLKSRVKNSSQGDRVLDFRRFLKEHGLTARH
jgi:hypothetical protein